MNALPLLFPLFFLPLGQNLTPAVGPLSPGEARKAMVVAPGLAMQLVASEPQVVDPVCATFDENGRLYAAEMRGYPNGGVGTGDISSGRISLLTDENHDGKYEKSVTFAQGLRFPMGLLPWRGGLLVAQAPEILYLKDTNNDGKADIRKTLYVGFALPNIQQLVNTLTLGLDGRIHAMVGGAGGDIRCPDVPAFNLSLRGRACSFDPDQPGSMRAETGGGQYGLAADRFGHWFTNTNSQHLRHIALPDSLLAGNPYLAPPAATVDIPQHGAATKVFRISEPEPWRVERTRRRAGSADAKRFPTTELVAGGYTTSTCSPLPTDGGLFTGMWRDAVLVCDPANNLITGDRLAPKGAGFTATRLIDGGEVVASKDNFFRPVHLSFMPDGAVMVCDFYREAIETPLSLPEDLKARMGLESKAKGRLWRLAPADKAQTALLSFPADLKGRLDKLGSDNPWDRFTAHRLILEQPGPDAVKGLHRLATSDPRPFARVHGLALLARLDALDSEAALACLNHPEAGVREVALVCLPAHRGKSPLPEGRAIELLEDTSPRVRFEAAAFAARSPGHEEALAKRLWHDADDVWIVAAAWSSTAPDLSRYLSVWAQEAKGHPLNATRAKLVTQAGIQVGARPPVDAVPLLARSLSLEVLANPIWRAPFLQGLSQGMRQAGQSIDAWWTPLPDRNGEPQKSPLATLEPLLRSAAVTSENVEASERDRLTAISTLALAPSTVWRDQVGDLLNNKNSPAVQLATIAALTGRSDAPLLAQMAACLPNLAPAARAELMAQLISGQQGAHSLLTALETGKVPAALVDAASRTALLNSRQTALKSRAGKLFASGSGARDEVVKRYQKAVLDGKTEGNLARGREVFVKNCAACHKTGDAANLGHVVGPELKAVLPGKDKAALILAILDPSREIDPRYAQMVAETKDGRTLAGLLAAETPVNVTLRRAEGMEDVILRTNLEALTATGKSLMPEGLENQITPDQMADLLEFLLQMAKGG